MNIYTSGGFYEESGAISRSLPQPISALSFGGGGVRISLDLRWLEREI